MRTAALAILTLIGLLPSANAQTPKNGVELVPFRGYIEKKGFPYKESAPITLTLSLWNSAMGGTPCANYVEEFNVTPIDGHFSVMLGRDDEKNLRAALGACPKVYVEVNVDGTTLTERRQLVASAYTASNPLRAPEVVADKVTAGDLAATNVQATNVQATAIAADAITADAITGTAHTIAGTRSWTFQEVLSGFLNTPYLRLTDGSASARFGANSLAAGRLQAVGLNTLIGGQTGSWIHISEGGANGVSSIHLFAISSGGVGSPRASYDFDSNGVATKPGGGSWATPSDERFKNIKGKFTTGLAALLKLQPIRYEYKPGQGARGEFIGFGAQSVQKVIPEAVSGRDGRLYVNNDPILWTMLNAIKEQQSQIEQLRAEVKRLAAATPTNEASRQARLTRKGGEQ